MEAFAKISNETDDPIEYVIETMAPLWKQVMLASKVSHPKPAGIFHVHDHAPNQSSFPSTNPEQYGEKERRLHNRVIIWL